MEPSHTADGIAKGGKKVWQFLKKLTMELPYDPGEGNGMGLQRVRHD